jgi:hypothetical protein
LLVLRTVAVSGAAFDAIAATFPVVCDTGPFEVVRLVLRRDAWDVPFLLVDRLLDVRDELFLPVDLVDFERPPDDRLLEARFVCAILIASLCWFPVRLPCQTRKCVRRAGRLPGDGTV